MKKHNSKVRKSLRSRKWQTRHTKRLQRRSYQLRRSRQQRRSRQLSPQQRRHQRRQRTYKLHGGVAEVKLPPPIETPSMPKIPGVMPRAIDEVQLQIARQNAEQLQANSKLAGGGGNYKRKKQHGGDVVTCGGSVMNGLDGYGYIPPTNCTMVPYTNDPTSQLLANSTTTTLVKNIVAAAGDK